MIVISNGVVTKNFIESDDIPEDNINEGDGVEDIEDWTDVASFVDDDEFVYSDEGTVFIFWYTLHVGRSLLYLSRKRIEI